MISIKKKAIPESKLNIMEENAKLIRVLNDLLELNNDRIEGYQLATKEAEEVELKNLFSDMTASGFKICHDLVSEVQKLNGAPLDTTSNSGKAFNAWSEVRSAIISNDRKAILNSCRVGEDAALDAYENALKQEEMHDKTLVEKVQQQRIEILRAHTLLKSLSAEVKK